MPTCVHNSSRSRGLTACAITARSVRELNVIYFPHDVGTEVYMDLCVYFHNLTAYMQTRDYSCNLKIGHVFEGF